MDGQQLGWRVKTLTDVGRVVVRNSALSMAAQIAIKGISFAWTIMIVRRLGEAAFGQYSAVLAYGALFVFMADLGLSPFAVREIARLRDAPDGAARVDALFGVVLRLRLVLALITAVVLITTVWLLGRPPVIVGAVALGTLGLLMYGVEGACETVLSGLERLDLVAGARFLWQVLFVGVGWVALTLKQDYYGLIYANLVGIAVMTVLCWVRVRRLGVRPRGRLHHPLHLLRASLPFGLIGFTLGLSYRFDTVLLSQFRGDAVTGFYNAAYGLVFATVMISNVINTSLYPSVTRQAVLNAGSLGQIYERVLGYLLIVSLPIAVGGCLLADQVVAFLYGPAYAPAVAGLRIIIWTAPLMFVSEFLGYMVLVNGQERVAARAVLCSTALNVACNLVLVPRFGLAAAAVMTVATEAVLVGQYVWRLRTILATLDLSRSVLRPALAAVLMGVLVVMVRGHLPFLGSVAVGALVYAALLLALRAIGSDEIAFVRAMRAPEGRTAS